MAEVNPTTEDDSSIVSENSFVILGQGSFPTEMNDNGTGTINSPFSLTTEENPENASVNGDLGGRNSPLPDANSIGIQIKLEKLLKENLLLKETLNQSNLAMKNQFETLALWHEEVVKTHESHKQKFEETQEQILKLKTENMNLKKLIQQNLELCCENDPTLLNMDFEGISPVLKTEADKYDEENSLKIYIRELKLKNKELEKRLHDIALEKCDLGKKLQDTLEEHANLKKEIERFKNCMYSRGQDHKSLTSNKAADEHEDDEKYGGIISLEPELSITDKLPGSVEAELAMAASKQDLMEPKKQPDEEPRNSKGLTPWESEQLSTMIAFCDGLAAQKSRLQEELDMSERINQDLANRIGQLNDELKEKDEKFKRKVDEFEKIKKEMEKLVVDYEEIAILRAQVELYQKDFNEERLARELAMGEKEKMAEQVRFLERALSNYKKENGNKRKASTPAPKDEEATPSYMCPKCMKRMGTLTECESHVEDCLNSDMFP